MSTARAAMQVEAFFDPATSTVSYLLNDPATRAARVAELQEALTRTSKEHEAAKAAHRESDEQWAQRERRLREQLIEVSDEVKAA
jgi:hypothetical protein